MYVRVYAERDGGIGVTEGEFRPAKAHLDRLGLSKGGGTPRSPSLYSRVCEGVRAPCVRVAMATHPHSPRG